ncbi:TonB-dependent receptor [bacterium]|nr:MAG: TonB-dependent receptor [bacterium]
MKKAALLWGALFVLQTLAFSQTITVKDREDLSPLELVTIVSQNPSVSAVTNARGETSITPFLQAIDIEVRRLGYKSARISMLQLKKMNGLILLEPNTLSMDQIVVSASRWKENASEVPNRISVLTPKDVSFQQPQTSADLLSVSGQVFVQKSQLGGGSPMIRGFSTNRVLISVDGVRMNNAIFRSGNLQNVINIDPFTIQQTEILFGPGSVMYGSDAIGGVMDFTTIKPVYSFSDKMEVSGNAQTRYSSANNEKTSHLTLQLGFDKLAYSGSVTYWDFDDLRMGKNGPDEYLRTFYVETNGTADQSITNSNPLIQKPTGYNQFNTLQKLRYRPAKNWDLEYAFTYSATSDYSRYDRLIRTRGSNPRSAEWNYGPQIWSMNHLSATYLGSNRFFDNAVIHTAYQFFKESRIDRDFGKLVRHTLTERVDVYSTSIDFSKNWNEKHTLSYGLDVVYNDVQSSGFDEDISTPNSQVDAQSRYPQATWFSGAVFAHYQYKQNEYLKWVSGLRYNYYQLDATFDTRFYPFPFTKTNLNDGAIIGSAGLIWNPVKTLTISGTLSTGFRSPNVDDMGKVFDSEPGSVVIPNPNLSSEYAYNAEFGIAQLIENRFKWDVSVFYTLLDNALVRRDFTLNGQDSILYDGELSQVQAIQNAAQATVWGIQGGIQVQLWRGLSVQSHLSYQTGEEELDSGETAPLRHAAPWFGVTRLHYSAKSWKLELNAQYNGEVSNADLAPSEQDKDYMYAIDENGNPYSPAWYTLNLKSQYRINEHWQLFAGLENITDIRYRPYSSGIVAAGRNVTLAVKAIF